MTIELTPRQQRLAAIVLALIPLLLVVGLAVAMASSWLAHHGRMAELKRERTVYERELGEAPQLRAAAATLRRQGASGAYFHSDGLASDAAAKMKSQIAAIVSQDGGTIRRNDVRLAAAGEGAPTELHAELAFLADIKSLARILFHLRRARPLVLVTQLSAHSNAASAALVEPNRLLVELAATAFVSPP